MDSEPNPGRRASEELLSIVVPVYRSAAYLAGTVHELLATLGPMGPLEVVLVNDGSPDDVQEVIESLAAADRRVRYLELGANRGQHAAILRGLEVARGAWVVTIDDDGQNPPEAVTGVLEALVAGDDDVVYGAFQSTEQTGLRVLASRLNRMLSAVTVGNRRGIAVSNVRAIRGDLARALGRAAPAHPYIEALVFRATRRISQVEVPHRPRQAGESPTGSPRCCGSGSCTSRPSPRCRSRWRGGGASWWLPWPPWWVSPSWSGSLRAARPRGMALALLRHHLPLRGALRLPGRHQHLPGADVRHPERTWARLDPQPVGRRRRGLMLVPVEWDSAFFGLRLGRVTAPVLDAGAAAAVVATGREQRFDCLSFLYRQATPRASLPPRRQGSSWSICG